MTGEITLRGKVLPIGGLKEKSLAARRVGIRKVIIPKDNQKDLEELPETVKRDIAFYPVSSADEVFALAVREAAPEKPKPRTPRKKGPVIPVGGDPVSPAVRCDRA